VAEFRVVVEGASRAPWFPNMVEVMDRDLDVLDDLASSWAEGREDLELEDFLSLYLPDEVVGRELADGAEPLPIRTACWLMFLHGYWGGVKLGRRFRRIGAARGAVESGIAEPKVPTAADLDRICTGLADVHAALAGSDGDRAAHLAASLRQPTQTGSLYGVAYNTGFFEPLLAHPPAGALPDHLEARSDLLDCADDRLLDIQYGIPVPAWLTERKAAHDAARAARPDRWRQVVDGTGGEVSLETVWHDGFRQGAYNWGGDTLANWTQPTLDAFLHTSLRFNIQVEAVAHAVMAAVVDPERNDPVRATRAAALFVPSWLGTAVGVGDELGERPTLKRVPG
jgi:hypothetical protein